MVSVVWLLQVCDWLRAGSVCVFHLLLLYVAAVQFWFRLSSCICVVACSFRVLLCHARAA